LVLLPTWTLSPSLAVAAATVTVLTAAYTLRAVRLAYYGAEYVGPHAEGLMPTRPRELVVLIPLVIAAVVLGVQPGIVTKVTGPAIAAAGQSFALVPFTEPLSTGVTPVADAADARRTTR
jgi:NADH-quinone oxidoreductase subunit M